MGAILEHLLIFGNADPFGLLSPLQRQHGIRFQLFGNAPCKLTHGRGLFKLLLFLADRQLGCLFTHLLFLGNPDAIGQVPAEQW